MSEGGAAQVGIRKRHVIYLHGYDPRGEKTYGRLLCEQYQAYCVLREVEGHRGVATAEEGGLLTRRIFRTRHEGREVETVYDYYGWEQCIRPDFDEARFLTIGRACTVLARWVREGMLGILFRASRKFAAFILYPFVLFFAFVGLAVICGIGVAAAIAHGSGNAGLAVLGGFIIAGSLVVAFSSRLTSKTFMMYLFAYIGATDRYVRGCQPAWAATFQKFAVSLLGTLRTTDADEVVIIGHSHGANVAADVLDRAAALEPDFAKRGPRVIFCSVGSCLPLTALRPRANALREMILRVTEISGLCWLDVQSRKDVINFCPFDPIRGLGLALRPSGRQPIVVEVRLRDVILPKNYATFRLHFFNIHFQFIKANERAGAPYDYFHWCFGPDRFGGGFAPPP